MTFEIRRARPADVDEIAAAHVDSIRSIGPRYYGPDIVSDWVARLEGGFYVDAMSMRTSTARLCTSGAEPLDWE